MIELLRDQAVVVAVPVAWGDLDAFGHVNNTRYFRWFEDGRIAFFDAVGIQEIPDRFTMRYVVVSEQHGKIAAEGEGQLVAFDYGTGQKSEYPDELRARIERLQADLPLVGR